MDFNQLKYFMTVAEEKNFTKAAHVLHISQPSLSVSMKNLENNLGLELIDRSKRTLHLTEEGKVLYKETKRLMNHFHHMEKEMARLKNEGPLELSIGIIETAKLWFPLILKEIKEKYEGIQITLLEILANDDVKEALMNYQIHFAITNQYMDTREIKSITLYEEKLVALIPNGHRLEKNDRIQIQDLKDEPLLLCIEGFQTRNDILNAFSRASIKPNIQFEFESFETACSLVEFGLGLTIVPENYVKYQKGYSFHIKHINDPGMIRQVYLAVNKNRHLAPVVEKSIQKVLNYHTK